MGLACADPTASRAVALKTLAPIKHLSIIARIGSLPVAALAKSSRDCTMPDAPVTALRGTIVSFTGDPFLIDTAESYVHEPDGLIVSRNGIIEAVGAYASVRATLPSNVPVTDYSGCILSAGFIDTHVQAEMIASPGKQLLPLLRASSFCNGSTTTSIQPRKPLPTRHARAVAKVFCDTLIRYDHGLHL